jgi:hypothetical protein
MREEQDEELMRAIKKLKRRGLVVPNNVCINGT